MSVQAPPAPTHAPPAPAETLPDPAAADGDVLVCPGCGAEVRIRRRDDGHTHTRKELACPSCGTELLPSPETEDPGPGPMVGGARPLPWHEGGRRRVA